jgi:hypothetical protein
MQVSNLDLPDTIMEKEPINSMIPGFFLWGIVFHRKIPSFLRNFHADLCISVIKNNCFYILDI